MAAMHWNTKQLYHLTWGALDHASSAPHVRWCTLTKYMIEHINYNFMIHTGVVTCPDYIW